jgi:hypothetical protein
MRDKRLATAVATLLAAFATAHLMQFGLSAGRAASGSDQAAPIGLATFVTWRDRGTVSGLPATPAAPSVAGVTAASLDTPDLRRPPDDRGVPETLGARGDRTGFGLACARRLTLVPRAGALVEARLDAPCDPGVRVELRHADLRFAVLTGADGSAAPVVPALTADARVEAFFADGSVVSARTLVPDVAEVERVVLVSDGWSGLTLRAFEAASWRGEDAYSRATARPGAMLRLGDAGIEAPLLAEVYTAPAGRFGVSDGPRLQVEADLSAANCARDVVADVLRSSGGVSSAPQRLRLSLPACGEDGGLLVVDLPPADLRFARN